MDFIASFEQKLVEACKTGQPFSIEGEFKELLRVLVEKVVNQVIGNEFSRHIGYDKNSQGASKESGNARNGYYERKLNSDLGELNLTMPRDRNGKFESQAVPKYQRDVPSLVNVVLTLNKLGATESEIQTALDGLYKARYSKAKISSIIECTRDDAVKFNERPLPSRFFAIFIDSIYIPLRRDTVSKEAVNIAIGIDENGSAIVLGFSITPEESATEWQSMFESFKNRGLQSSRFVVSDGLAGIDNVIRTAFGSKCLHQRCFVHVCRNLAAKVKLTDRAAIMQEFMALASLASKEQALSAFSSFINKWGEKYVSISRWATTIDLDPLFAFYELPPSLRKLVYTTNRIEGFNKEIRRNAKAHIQFPIVESEEAFLAGLSLNYNLRVGKRRVRQHKEVVEYMNRN